MGLQIRDDRQMKALTGLSQAQFHHLLSVFSDIYRATQQQTYEKGVESGTRRRHPGGGSKGKLPTMAEKLQSLLLDSRVLADQQLNKRTKQRFASLSHVVNELEEPEVEWEFFL